jgi:hypothetical protein
MSYVNRLIPEIRPNYQDPKNNYEFFWVLWITQIVCIAGFGALYGIIYYVDESKNITG